MRTPIIAALLCALTTATLAAPAPYPITINSRVQTAPPVVVYRAGEHVFRATFADGSTASDITGDTPFMAWATNATASAISTSSYSVVSATNGIVDFTFSPAALNYTAGRYIYEIGVVSGGNPRVYRQGVFTIQGSPYATGADPSTWTTNLNTALITVVGTWPLSSIPFDDYTDAEALAAAIAGGCITNGIAIDTTNLTYYPLTTAVNASNDVQDAALAALTNDIANGATAYGWGDHGTNGYLQAEADTNALAQLATHTGLVGTAAHGLGTASTNATGDFATAAQGSKADSALQAESDPVWTNAQATGFSMGGTIEMGSENIDFTGTTALVIRHDGITPDDGSDLAGAASIDEINGFSVYSVGATQEVLRAGESTIYGPWLSYAIGTVTPYTPTAPAHVANKKYVDDNAGGSGGGSTARVIPVDNYYLNQAVRPSIKPLQDGSGDVRDYYEWDFEDVDRLDPIEIYAAAGTYAPVFSSAAFVTNALTQTNSVLIGYVNGLANCTSAVVNLSAVTIDTYRTNGLLSVTGSVSLATGWHEFDARIDSVGGTNGLIYSRDINIDIGSAQ